MHLFLVFLAALILSSIIKGFRRNRRDMLLEGVIFLAVFGTIYMLLEMPAFEKPMRPIVEFVTVNFEWVCLALVVLFVVVTIRKKKNGKK